MHDTTIDIHADTRIKLCALLNLQLADTFDLFSQIKQAHWNVKGAQFYSLHLLFDKLAEEVEEHSDILAERITALGGAAQGTARMVVKSSRLPEMPLDLGDSQSAVKLVGKRFSVVAESTRKAIDEAGRLNDFDTADLFTGMSRDLDKSLWFLEAHLQG